MTKKQQESSTRTVCVLGASFDTGNLGVSALAESTVKALVHKWPDAEIVLLGSGYEPREFQLSLAGKELTLRVVPVRFKSVGLPYHFLWYVLYGMLARLVPGSAFKRRLMRRNPHCAVVHECTLIADITGGDSFSDIYGMRRFVLGFLQKWLAVLYGKRFVMLPQTYGPFAHRLSRLMARHILNRAEAIYSRDKEGIEYLTHVVSRRTMGKVRFSPDVAFILDPRRPPELQIEPDTNLRARGSVVIGLNISGLLYNGGYTQDNAFGLKADYPALVRKIAELLLGHKETVLLLVPHVFPPAAMQVESDPIACRQLSDALRTEYGDRVFLASGQYNHNEAKYIIGLCDFFLGSRMHACIAALSQGIPTVGLAYSRKFAGVFGTVGMASWAVDLRDRDEQAVLAAISQAFEQRHAVGEDLRKAVSEAQKQILGMFDDL